MEITPAQRALFESSLTALETGVGQLNLAIEQFDQKRAEFIANRDVALKQIADIREKFGLVSVVQ